MKRRGFFTKLLLGSMAAPTLVNAAESASYTHTSIERPFARVPNNPLVKQTDVYTAVLDDLDDIALKLAQNKQNTLDQLFMNVYNKGSH